MRLNLITYTVIMDDACHHSPHI